MPNPGGRLVGHRREVVAHAATAYPSGRVKGEPASPNGKAISRRLAVYNLLDVLDSLRMVGKGAGIRLK